MLMFSNCLLPNHDHRSSSRGRRQQDGGIDEDKHFCGIPCKSNGIIIVRYYHRYNNETRSDCMYDESVVMRLQPNEAVYMKTNVKSPGLI